MPCDMSSSSRLAEQGWNEDEIQLLEKEIELARQKAKSEAYKAGFTYETQQRKIRQAEKDARKIAHDRMHAKLEGMMHEINGLKKKVHRH